MAKLSHQKLKLLYIMKILLEKTDEEHTITVNKIIMELKSLGISAARKSVYEDLELLKLFGLDIEKRKTKTHDYYIASREFQLPELKLLVDSIQASKFITHKKSMELIKKIETLTSKYNANNMQRQVFVYNRVKSMNESIYYNVDRLHEANVFCKLRDNTILQKASGNNYKENSESFDDLDVAKSGANFWRVPKSDIDWRDNLTIDLSFDEAKYLMQKIKSMPKTKDTLFALILNENIEEFVNFESFDDLDGVMSIMTPEIRRDYEMARDFSRFIFGSQIRYNVIFSKGENETANDLWEEWQDNIPNINLEEIFIRLSVKNNNLKYFLRQYQSLITDTPKLDDLIINREKQLKGSSRAKLVNDKLYSYKEQTINMYQLSYRMFNTQTIVKDIFEGVCQDA